jgi:membrane protein
MPAALRKAIQLTGCAARYWSSDNASTTGAALAFYCAFSLAPLLVIVLTLAGLIVGANAAFGQVGAVGTLDFLVSLALVSALFALIYRYMPTRRLAWHVVLAGGVLTAVLFDIGRWAIGLYLAHSTQPSAFGAAASFAALLLWLYYTAQIFLFGAEFTACLGGVRDEKSNPDKSGPGTRRSR